MLPLNWLRKEHPNQIQAHVRGDGGDLLQWIRERISHAPHGVRPSRMSAFWLRMPRPGTPLSHPLSGSQPGLLKRGEKGGKTEKKDGKRQPPLPSRQDWVLGQIDIGGEID